MRHKVTMQQGPFGKFHLEPLQEMTSCGLRTDRILGRQENHAAECLWAIDFSFVRYLRLRKKQVCPCRFGYQPWWGSSSQQPLVARVAPDKPLWHPPSACACLCSALILAQVFYACLLFFLVTSLLRYNSHTIQFTHFKCAIQCFLVYL